MIKGGIASAEASASKLRYKIQIQPGLARTITWYVTFTPDGAAQPGDYRFLSEGVTAEATETQVHTLDPFDRFGTQPGNYQVLAFEAEQFSFALTVDANRDGVILPPMPPLTDYVIAHADATTTPYRFWLNDDDDNGQDINGDDTPGAAAPDGQQVKVQGTRDLVDFFPVFLDLKQLLTVLPPSASVKYKLKQADDGLRFVYTDLSRADAFKYLKDSATGNSLKEADAHWVTAAG